MRTPRRTLQALQARLQDAVGSRARLRVVVVLAGVLALDSADKATVGAVAPQLKSALQINNTEIGLLATTSTAIAALATLPIGMLTDRINRTQLLVGAIVVWSAAMVVSGASGSFPMLLFTRLALGAVAATASPAIASLIGDLFPAGERGRIYGFILTGELLGAGIGFLVSGDVAAVLSWRWAFWLLAAIGFGVAVLVWRFLAEPARGGSEQLQPDKGTRAARAAGPDVVEEEVEQEDVQPHDDLVLDRDPTHRSLWWAVRYVLSIRTNRVLILASALGYFFFSGLRTFAVVFMGARFDLSQGAASSLLVLIGLGAIAGALTSGRLGDRLISRGNINARPVLAGSGYLVAVVLFVPGLLVTGLHVAAPLFFVAAAGFGAANPPLDAARLDLVHHRLWGRAESVRTVFRAALEAMAPLLFGYVSTLFGGQGASLGEPSTGASSGLGLDRTFLVMLVPLLAAGLLLCLRARRTYARDVATAVASVRRLDGETDSAGSTA